jgi:hypothetical protein
LLKDFDVALVECNVAPTRDVSGGLVTLHSTLPPSGVRSHR